MTKILITGITGSLGQRLIPHFITKGFEVRGLSRCEDKQATLQREYPEIDLHIQDITDRDIDPHLFKDVDIVVHTAALKRVEMGEKFPIQFIKTNIQGTINMVETAKCFGIKKFVFISTDKAVEPVNVYGMSKTLAEKIVVNAGYNCVRYGNVNNSRGSVIPYWKELKAQGKPLTVTSPHMTRFLIDFNQAIKMIDIALENPMRGDIFIPKLPAANMVDIAKLISSDIVFTRERPGEKLREVLINEDEFRNRTEERQDYYIIHKTLHDKYFKVQTDNKGNRREYSSDNTNMVKGKALRMLIKNV